MTRFLPFSFFSSTADKGSLACGALLGFALLWLAPCGLLAQSLTFAGSAPAVNFGNADLCKVDQSMPAPCTVTRTLDYKVTESGTLGAIRVVTQGVPDLDFDLASGSSCKGKVSASTTCTVVVTFSPRLAGGRAGAVQITNQSGAVLVTTPIYGAGIGPQIGTLSNGVSKALPFSSPLAVTVLATPMALDGADNLFLVNGEYTNSSVVESPANGEPLVTLPFDFTKFQHPNGDYQVVGGVGLAVDGAGDVLVTTHTLAGEGVVLELPGGGGPQIVLPFGEITSPSTLAVDGAGDVFVEDVGAAGSTTADARVLKLPFGCKSSACQSTVYTGWGGLFAVDVAGNVFLDFDDLVEIPAGGDTPVTLAFGMAGPLAVDGVDDLFGTTFTFFDDGGEDYGEIANAVELPAGHTQPITLGWLGASYSYDTATGSAGYGLAADAAGNVFVTVTGGPTTTAQEFERSAFAPLDFGTVLVGSTKTLPLGITNTGNRTLILTPSFESPSYKIVSEAPAGCLQGTAPGNTCTAQIEFSALSEGEHQIALTLGSNGAADAVVQLLGVGSIPK